MRWSSTRRWTVDVEVDVSRVEAEARQLAEHLDAQLVRPSARLEAERGRSERDRHRGPGATRTNDGLSVSAIASGIAEPTLENHHVPFAHPIRPARGEVAVVVDHQVGRRPNVGSSAGGVNTRSSPTNSTTRSGHPPAGEPSSETVTERTVRRFDRHRRRTAEEDPGVDRDLVGYPRLQQQRLVPSTSAPLCRYASRNRSPSRSSHRHVRRHRCATRLSRTRPR